MVAEPNTPLHCTPDLSNASREQPNIESNAEHYLQPVTTKFVERASNTSRRFSSPVLHVFVGKPQQIFSAHKAVLEQSPVLAAGINLIDDSVSIDLQKVDPSTFSLLLEFLYTSILVVDIANPYHEVLKHLCRVYSAAELLALHTLRVAVLAQLGRLGHTTLTNDELDMFLAATLTVYNSGHADEDFRHTFRSVIFAYMTRQAKNDGVFQKAAVLRWPIPVDITVPAMQALDFVKSFTQKPNLPLEVFCGSSASLDTTFPGRASPKQNEPNVENKKEKNNVKDVASEADFSEFYKEIEVNWRDAQTLRDENLATRLELESSCASLRVAEEQLKSMAFEIQKMKEEAETWDWELKGANSLCKSLGLQIQQKNKVTDDNKDELPSARASLPVAQGKREALALTVEKVTEAAQTRAQELKSADTARRSMALQIQQLTKASKTDKRKLNEANANLCALQGKCDSATADLKTERRKNGELGQTIGQLRQELGKVEYECDAAHKLSDERFKIGSMGNTIGQLRQQLRANGIHPQY